MDTNTFLKSILKIKFPADSYMKVLICVYLNQNKSLSFDDFRDYIDISKGNISKVINHLIKNNLVIKVKDGVGQKSTYKINDNIDEYKNLNKGKKDIMDKNYIHYFNLYYNFYTHRQIDSIIRDDEQKFKKIVNEEFISCFIDMDKTRAVLVYILKMIDLDSKHIQFYDEKIDFIITCFEGIFNIINYNFDVIKDTLLFNKIYNYLPSSIQRFDFISIVMNHLKNNPNKLQGNFRKKILRLIKIIT